VQSAAVRWAVQSLAIAWLCSCSHALAAGEVGAVSGFIGSRSISPLATRRHPTLASLTCLTLLLSCTADEPGSSLTSRTRVKTLAYDTILANSRFFHHDIGAVPKMALTVGVGTVMDAREVVVIITGPGKARALSECIENGVNHMWTVSALQLHPR
jgi:hypothetical protein